MTDRILYTIVLPGDALTEQSHGSESAVQRLETVNADFGSSIQTGSQPSQSPLRGQMRGAYADGMAQEIDEIASNSDIKEVVLRGKNDTIPQAGYYTVRSGGMNEVDPRSDNLQGYNVDLDEIGTRKSHYRTVESTIESVNCPYSASLSAYVAMPHNATNPRWFNPETGESEEASPATSQRVTEYGDVTIFDANSDPSFGADPHLVYDVDYGEEGFADARVYDDRGRSKFDNGNRAWDRVFSTAHDYRGEVVLSNGIVRVYLDEANNNMSFEEYSFGSWGSGSLNASTWTFREISVRSIGQVSVETQMVFYDSGTYYHLNAALRRGADGIFFTVPSNEASIPADLEDKLEPLSWGRNGYDSQPTKTVKPRREVMR
jgi:hypothetical protein